MIYLPPSLTDSDEALLNEIEDLRERLRFFLVRPRRWYGSLRRVTVALAVQGSNSIEGYHATVEDVVAIIDGEDPSEAGPEIRHAIEGYQDALTYVLELAKEPPAIDVTLVKALHFMMMKHELTKNPGQWRPGAVWIEDSDGEVVYEAPERDDLDALVAEALSWVNEDDGPVYIGAAMAHLNLTLIHPFSDGNGRMARCIQTYVLASRGLVSPVFCSVEEYLGRHTLEYYQVLAEVAAGVWSPQRSARPWIEFSLTAHRRQALTLLRRIDHMEALWDRCEQLARAHRLPTRCVAALCDVARGWRLTRALYIKTIRAATGDHVSEAMATRDLRALVDAGLVVPVGERRARRYEGSPALLEIYLEIRSS